MVLGFIMHVWVLELFLLNLDGFGKYYCLLNLSYLCSFFRLEMLPQWREVSGTRRRLKIEGALFGLYIAVNRPCYNVQLENTY